MFQFQSRNIKGRIQEKALILKLKEEKIKERNKTFFNTFGILGEYKKFIKDIIYKEFDRSISFTANDYYHEESCWSYYIVVFHLENNQIKVKLRLDYVLELTINGELTRHSGYSKTTIKELLIIKIRQSYLIMNLFKDCVEEK